MARDLQYPQPMTILDRVQPMQRSRYRASKRGFTLIELAVVVTIIGILALLAVAGYSRLIKASHITEATEMVNAIKLAQEQYHAETGSYANVSASLNVGDTYPAATPGQFKTVWGGTCSTCSDPDAWKRLPVHASGALLYGYATVAGPQGAALPATPISSITLPAASAMTSDWFIIVAKGDQDGNGVFATVMGVSWTRDLFTDKDTE
jgi:type IV pilus assembly protein PilA